MEDFWDRRKRANRAEKLVGVYLAISIALCLLLVYALLRSVVSVNFLEGSLALTLEEVVAVLILVASSTWVFVRTLEQNATAIMVSGLRARALKHDRSDESGLQDLVDHLVNETGVVRLEVLICDLPSMNFLALRTFEGRNLIFVTEGAVNRLDARLLKAGLTQCMVRLNQPESRARSAYCFMYASLQQLSLGFKDMGKKSKVSAIAGFRFMGGLVSAFGLPLRLSMDPARALAAEEEAARLTRDPVAMAELISRLHVQWSGTSIISPGLNCSALSDLRWTSWVGADPKQMRTQTTEQISPITRIQKILSTMQVEVAPLFKVARTKRAPRREENSSDSYYRVIRKGRVEGPHDTSTIQSLNWMSARTVVQSVDGGAPGLAFEFDPLRRLYSGRFQPCPRCGLSLSPYVHQKVEMHRCMKCHGILTQTKHFSSLGIREWPDAKNRSVVRRMKYLAKRANAFLNRPESEGARVFPQSKCPDCRKPMGFSALPFQGLPLVLTCDPCESVWFDAEELPALLERLDRLISWERVLQSESDMLLPHPDLVVLSKEDHARAAGVQFSKQTMADFMGDGATPGPKKQSKNARSDPGKGSENEDAPPAPKKGLIRGAFVPRDAEDVRRERTLKARRERFRKGRKEKEASKEGSPVEPKPNEPKD